MKLNPPASELRWAATSEGRLVALWSPPNKQAHACLIPRDAVISTSFDSTWVRNYLSRLNWQPWDNTNHSFLEQKDQP